MPTPCLRCGQPFTPKDKRGIKKKYCTPQCQGLAGREKMGFGSEFPNIASGTVGAINELRVCVDLMAKGLDVFRCQSPHSKADLIFISHEKCYRVAVKTAYKSNANGKIYHPAEKHKFDVLALATKGEIIYRDFSGEEFIFPASG